jgi:hypothetical protein
VTPPQFAAAIHDGLRRVGVDEEQEISRWQLLEVLAASVGSLALRHELQLAIGGMTDRAEWVVRAAQEKGLLLADLPPRALAHFLLSLPLGSLFLELDGARVDPALWADLLARAVVELQPQPEQSRV